MWYVYGYKQDFNMGSQAVKNQYRAEFTINACKEYGWESEICRTATDIFEMQLASQYRMAQIGQFGNLFNWLVLLFFIGVGINIISAKLTSKN